MMVLLLLFTDNGDESCCCSCIRCAATLSAENMLIDIIISMALNAITTMVRRIDLMLSTALWFVAPILLSWHKHRLLIVFADRFRQISIKLSRTVSNSPDCCLQYTCIVTSYTTFASRKLCLRICQFLSAI